MGRYAGAMSNFTLEGRIAVVTGATAGIGEAIVRDLVAAGAAVVMNGRRREKLEALTAELGSEDVVGVAGDAADPRVVGQMLDVARATFGGGKREADLVVVNAGRGLSGSVVTSDTAQWEEMVRTNLLGAAHLIREAGQRMTSQAGELKGDALWASARDIVVLGSTVGRHISPFSSMYGATKFAVNSLAEAARRELGPKGVRVTLIEPGFVVSEFQQVAGYEQAWFEEVKNRIGPVLTPADVSKSVLFTVGLPAAVHVSDIVIRPTRQDYP